MSIFLTGATGYIGSYVATNILRDHKDGLAVLVRAKSKGEARKRLWKSLQLHMGFEEFQSFWDRIDIYLGDLTSDGLGLNAEDTGRLVESMDSVLHVAASLNRKSAKACFNVNLRGTLSMIKLARRAHDDHGLKRFSDVSTVAVAGHRQDEVVLEDQSIDWRRSDYDPYARTKKFCEHMVDELLPDVPQNVFRPSIVLGDSRFPETVQFDMVRAFAMLAQVPVLPLQAEHRVDIVPADYVGAAITKIHQDPNPEHRIYHLSSGTASLTFGAIVEALQADGHGMKHKFLPQLRVPLRAVVEGLSLTPKPWKVAYPASLMKVFLPYLYFNTVFDNTRVVAAMGEKPVSFADYAYDLLRFAREGGYRYPYKPWPARVDAEEAA